MNKYYELNKDLDNCTIILSSLGYGKCFHEIKRLRKLYENEIKVLQKKAELGEHYKHLYSEVKKQKDDDIRGLISEIRQLQSNWNSLREWLMQLKNSYMETDNIFDDAKFRILLSILDKMNELEKSDIIER